MGVPINNYTFFKAVAEGDKGTLDHAFEADFGLFTFILHDPEHHTDFAEKLFEDFHALNLATGKDLLFTALADPPTAWLDWARQNHHYAKLSLADPDKLHDPALIPQTFNPSYTASYIAECLNIHYHYLPAIVGTNDLQGNDFWFLPTSRESILQHMIQLTDLARDIKGGRPPIDALLSGILDDSKKVHLEDSSFVDLLIKISAELYRSSKNTTHLRHNHVSGRDLPSRFNRPQRHAEPEPGSAKSMERFYLSPSRRLEKKRQQRRTDSPTSRRGNPQENPLGNLMGFGLVHQTPQARPSSSPIVESAEELEKRIDLSGDLLNPDSLSSLKQGIAMAGFSQGFGDSAPTILPFVKALEMELNYSIVHWVRDRLFIDLPRYYYEYEPGKEAIVEEGEKTYEFNGEYQSQWSPPTMHAQISGFRVLVNRNQDNPFQQKELFEAFLKLLYPVKNIRNTGGHVRSTNEEDLLKVIQSWQSLFDRDYLVTMAELKDKFKNG